MKKKHRVIFYLLITVLLFFNVLLPACAETDVYVPNPLEPWKKWVLHGEHENLCPPIFNNAGKRICTFPSRLHLKLSKEEGLFEQEWLVYAPEWVILPGNTDNWPQHVSLDNNEIAVIGKNNFPAIFLEPGTHTINGRLIWDNIPETLHIPTDTAFINIELDGGKIINPSVDQHGYLWLGQRKATVISEMDTTEIKIFRFIDDNIPLTIKTLIRLNVSGTQREVQLKNILLKDSIPVSVESSIPVRFGAQKEIITQVKPGRYEIIINTREPGQITSLGPVQEYFGQEIWTFSPRRNLRIVEVQGAPSIDPGQTDMPESWRGYPAFLISPETELKFMEILRGDPDPPPNRLDLHKTWWLDFNGKGVTVQDRINGIMHKGWSLLMNPPTELGRVTIGGIDQLITVHSHEKKTGIEVRQGNINLTAESRINDFSSTLPTTGWDHDFQSISGEFNIPPGWKLFAVNGVDSVSYSWIDAWSLWDIFLVILIALFCKPILKLRWSILLFIMLVLSYHEHYVPRFVWIHIFAALAIIKFLPQNFALIRKAAKVWWVMAFIFMAFISTNFIIHQARTVIYPQLDSKNLYGHYSIMSALGDLRFFNSSEQIYYDTDEVIRDGYSTSVPMISRSESISGSEKMSTSLKKLSSKNKQASQNILLQDPNAIVQTGPGLPEWQWSKIYMNWSGPVDESQKIKVWLISPAVNFFLSMIRVFMLLVIFIKITITGFPKYDFKKIQKLGLAAACILLLCCSIPNTYAEATPEPATSVQSEYGFFPPEHLLKELKARLLSGNNCFPNCAEINRMDIEVKGRDIFILLEVHAAADTVVPLPGNARSWLPSSAFIKHELLEGIFRDEFGVIWANISKGIHRVEIKGKLEADMVEIPLNIIPRFSRIIDHDTWQISGVQQSGQTDPSIQFSKTVKDLQNSDTSADDSSLIKEIESFLHIRRIIKLGLEWGVETTVTRITPAGVPVVASIPLLNGESVTSPNIRIEKDAVALNMSAYDTQVSWNSSLLPDEQAIIKLKASNTLRWIEEWVLDAAPIWHTEISGINAIHHQDEEQNYLPVWQPWPGETIEIEVSRPMSFQGQAMTIAQTGLGWFPGNRLTKMQLHMNIRSSQGGHHTIRLPEEKELLSFTINGNSQPIHNEQKNDGLFLIPIHPGMQDINITWQEKKGASLLSQASKIDIGEHAVNTYINANIPSNQWILFVGGPTLGPAVLFWSLLASFFVISLILGNIPLTPLKWYHWFLLSLGLTQIPLAYGGIIVGWLLILGLRRKYPFSESGEPSKPIYFNLCQIMLVLCSILALACMITALKTGLLGYPDMQIIGNGSNGYTLNWTQDRINGVLPQPWVFSLPIWCYRVLMLAWSFWLAQALIKWLKWGWRCYSQGTIWHKKKKKKKTAQQEEVFTL